MKKILLFSFIGILVLIMNSCKKEELETNTQAAQDHLFAEKIFNDINRLVEDAFNDNGLSKSSCASYKSIASDLSNVDTLIVDFGNLNCLDDYGKLRRGKIIVIYTGSYKDSGSIFTTTFDHYYVNNTNWVQGTRTVTNKGRNTNGNILFDVEVDAKITTTSGRIDWASSRKKEWFEGNNTTQNAYDDIYKVTGTASGNGLNNKSFHVQITDTLEVNLKCLLSSITHNQRCVIVSGKVKITPEGYSERLIDYGQGNCNCNFTVILNGKTYHLVIDD